MRYQLAVPIVMLALAALLLSVYFGVVDIRLALAFTFACAVALMFARARRMGK